MTDGPFKAFLQGEMPNYYEYFRRVRRQRFWDTHLFPALRRRVVDEYDWIRGQ